MDTQELPAFDINHHRYVAQQVQTGRAHHHMVESSQEMLLAEVERLTYLISPAKLKQPAKGEPVEAHSLGPIIAALTKQPRNASVAELSFAVAKDPADGKWKIAGYNTNYNTSEYIID